MRGGAVRAGRSVSTVLLIGKLVPFLGRFVRQIRLTALNIAEVPPGDHERMPVLLATREAQEQWMIDLYIGATAASIPCPPERMRLGLRKEGSACCLRRSAAQERKPATSLKPIERSIRTTGHIPVKLAWMR